MTMDDNCSSDSSSSSSTLVPSSLNGGDLTNRSTSWTEVNYNDLKIHRTIGRGTYGQVSLATWRNSNVAVKIMETDAEKKAFTIELKHLHRVKHRNIVTLYGACTRPKACLVMELMECGSMHDLLHVTTHIHYTLDNAIFWAMQCADAVAYLHQIRLVHRDLKPPKFVESLCSNHSFSLLLTDHYRLLKICDFGTVTDVRSTMTNNRGSAAWMAPEVFAGIKYGDKCDVYSFGVILWEMIVRRKPFEELGGSAYRIMWRVHEGARPPLVAGIPSCLQQLMSSCWHTDPNARPSMKLVTAIIRELSSLFPAGNQPLIITQPSSMLDNIVTTPDAADLTVFGSTEQGEIIEAMIGPGYSIQTPHLPPPPPRIHESTDSLSGSASSIVAVDLNSSSNFIQGHRRVRSYETALLSVPGGESIQPNMLVSTSSTSIMRRLSSSACDRPQQLPKPTVNICAPTPPIQNGRIDEIEYASIDDGDQSSLIFNNNLPTIDPRLLPPPPDGTMESQHLHQQHIALCHQYLEVQQKIESASVQKSRMIAQINRGLAYQQLLHTRDKLIAERDELQRRANVRRDAN